MSIPLSINGQVFEYPENFDEDWGVAATGWAQAVTNGVLQRQGGNFPLTADANFGASFGLVAAYYTSRATNPATAGTLRLASADPGVAFRNNANSGNLILTTDSSDNLLYNGNIISPSGAGTVTSITGTANEIIASSATGNITLSTPQAIASTSSPTFASLTLTNPLSVANGGTGGTTLTAYAVLTGGTTSTGPLQSIASVGTAGQVLTSNGAGALPTFTNATGTGTVNSGTTPNIAYYATSSSILSDSGISRANLFLADGTVSATGAFNLNSHKITGLSAATINGDAARYEQVIRADGSNPFTGNQSMGSNKITSLANGSSAQDAVAFNQVSGTRVLQMVQVVGGAQVSSSSSSYSSTNIAATITPASSSSKIKISITTTGLSTSNGNCIYSIFRGSTDLGDSVGGFGSVNGNSPGSTISNPICIVYLDSPATASPVTYTLKLRNSLSGTVSIPAGAGPSSSTLYGQPTILLEEIG